MTIPSTASWGGHRTRLVHRSLAPAAMLARAASSVGSDGFDRLRAAIDFACADLGLGLHHVLRVGSQPRMAPLAVAHADLGGTGYAGRARCSVAARFPGAGVGTRSRPDGSRRHTRCRWWGSWVHNDGRRGRGRFVVARIGGAGRQQCQKNEDGRFHGITPKQRACHAPRPVKGRKPHDTRRGARRASARARCAHGAVPWSSSSKKKRRAESRCGASCDRPPAPTRRPSL
jgi:hypothetical protein